MPKYPPLTNRRRGGISQRLLAKTWQYPSLLSDGPCFCSRLFKVERAVKIFKNAQRLFSYFCSFQPYHFSQTQTGATVPLNSNGPCYRPLLTGGLVVVDHQIRAKKIKIILEIQTTCRHHNYSLYV